MFGWRKQSIYKKRLQILLGMTVSTFISLLAAIALREDLIYVFVLNSLIFLTYFFYAVFEGKKLIQQQHLRPVQEDEEPLVPYIDLNVEEKELSSEIFIDETEESIDEGLLF